MKSKAGCKAPKLQLEMLENVQARIKEDEAALAAMMNSTQEQEHGMSIPGMEWRRWDSAEMLALNTCASVPATREPMPET